MAYENESITPMGRLFRMLSLDRKEIIMLYIYGIFNGLINLSLPLGIQAIISLVIGGSVSTSWGILIFIVVLGVAASGAIQILQMSLTELLQRRVFIRASLDLAYRIPRFKSEALQGKYAPELMNRFFDTISIQKALPKILIDFSTSILQIFFGLVLLSFYHSFFVFFGAILMVLLILIFAITGPQGLKTSMIESKYKYQVAHWLEEMARLMGTLKLAGHTELAMHRMDFYVTQYLKNRKRHFGVLVFQYSNIVAFKTIVTGGLLILGTVLLMQQSINLGQFVASEIIILLVLGSVEKLILTMDSVYDVLTGVEKIGQVTDLELESDKGLDFSEVDNQEGIEIELRGLTFKYPGATKATLKNIDLHIRAGEKVCITGPNNSGKTTLLNLIAGLYTDFKGGMHYNGIPLQNLEIISLRSVIGDNLTQEDLFSGTLAENISMGKPEITVNDMIHALQQVGLESFFKNLPLGLDTQITPEGSQLASSTKQKLILSRTIAEKPKLVILDNVLRGLDFFDREAISELLTSKKESWTLVAVTNDPLLISKCDRVLYIEDGQLTEKDASEDSDQNLLQPNA